MAGRQQPHLFYRAEYVYDVLEAGTRHTFDVEKPRRIRNALVASGAARPEQFIAPDAVGDPELRLVHTADYLTEIRRPDTLARLLFLDPQHPWDARLLEPFLYATGGTIGAARAAAAAHGLAVNLGGGFHHAQADRADGFCALADVAIAIRALQRSGQTARTLIVDLDYHHGNGNAEIFASDDSVFTFSIHAGNWCWITKHTQLRRRAPVAHRGRRLPRRAGAAPAGHPRPFRAGPVSSTWPAAIRSSTTRLGDFDISEAGMLARDQFVTRELWGRGIPMVVVTAGGYGPASWRIHFNYFHWLLTDAAATGIR